MNENVAYWNTEALSCVSMAYSSLKALLPNTSIQIFFMFYVYGTKYSRMDQVKFVEDSLNNFTWSIFEYLVPYFISSIMNVVFYAISYHLYNLKNVKNSHEGVLLFVKLHGFSLQLQ